LFFIDYGTSEEPDLSYSLVKTPKKRGRKPLRILKANKKQLGLKASKTLLLKKRSYNQRNYSRSQDSEPLPEEEEEKEPSSFQGSSLYN